MTWSIPLWAGLLIGAWMDVRTRRIPNRLTVSFAVVGLILAAVGLSRVDVWGAFASMSAAFAVMFVPFVIRLYRGGDLKLVVAASAWLTPAEALWSVAMGVVLGGVMGLCQIGFQKGPWQRITATLWLILMGGQTDTLSVVEDQRLTVPMAVAFGTAVLATIYVGVPW
jgi:Flp pilus assembly protein protease CpaA